MRRLALLCVILLAACVAPEAAGQQGSAPCTGLGVGVQPATVLAGERANVTLVLSNGLAEAVTLTPTVRMDWEAQATSWGTLAVAADSLRGFPRVKQVTEAVGDHQAFIAIAGSTAQGQAFACPVVQRTLTVLPVFPLEVAIEARDATSGAVGLTAHVAGGVPPYQVTWVTADGNRTGLDLAYEGSDRSILLRVEDARGEVRLATYAWQDDAPGAEADPAVVTVLGVGLGLDRLLAAAQLLLWLLLLAVVLARTRRARGEPAPPPAAASALPAPLVESPGQPAAVPPPAGGPQPPNSPPADASPGSDPSP